MAQCSISNSSLKFARNVSGLLIFIAFLLRSIPMAEIMAVIILIGAISLQTNLFYQTYFKAIGKLLNDKLIISEKDKGEVTFSWTMAGLFLLIGLALIYFNFTLAGWMFILATSLLMFCAGFLNFCVASMMYAVFKKMLQSNKK